MLDQKLQLLTFKLPVGKVLADEAELDKLRQENTRLREIVQEVYDGAVACDAPQEDIDRLANALNQT